jgi:hypothetical protein
MKSLALFCLFLLPCTLDLQASEPGHCPQCEINREYNRTHPNKYEYYDDYLKTMKDQGNLQKQTSENPPKENEKSTIER